MTRIVEFVSAIGSICARLGAGNTAAERLASLGPDLGKEAGLPAETAGRGAGAGLARGWLD